MTSKLLASAMYDADPDTQPELPDSLHGMTPANDPEKLDHTISSYSLAFSAEEHRKIPVPQPPPQQHHIVCSCMRQTSALFMKLNLGRFRKLRCKTEIAPSYKLWYWLLIQSAQLPLLLYLRNYEILGFTPSLCRRKGEIQQCKKRVSEFLFRCVPQTVGHGP